MTTTSLRIFAAIAIACAFAAADLGIAAAQEPLPGMKVGQPRPKPNPGAADIPPDVKTQRPLRTVPAQTQRPSQAQAKTPCVKRPVTVRGPDGRERREERCL
jgi:hypothetical protein